MQDELLTRLIFESAMQLHESLDAGDVVASAIALLPAVAQADSWAVFLKSDQAERLELVRATNAAILPRSPFVELESAADPLVRAALEQRTIVSGTTPDQPHTGLLFAREAHATCCVPLVVGGRLIGAVQATRVGADYADGSRDFSPQEVKATELVCRSLGRALANAIAHYNATRQSLVDDLTRLYNVRYLYQTLDNEIRRARRYGSSVSVVFMDLDGFKLVNDAYGHRAGSVTLTEVASVITMLVRDADVVARFGGDEFVMMLPESSAQQATQMAERVRAEIAAHRFNGGVGADIYLTASFGVASFPEHATEAEKLIELADSAMYEAKISKKNSVKVAVS
jgi:diguanylate cyclase (GGDEF)-like protein